MLLCVWNMRRGSIICVGLIFLAAASLTLERFSAAAFAAGANPRHLQSIFASPEEAVQALAAALKGGDLKVLSDILGPDGKEILASGDEIADKNGRALFVRMYEQNHKLKRETDTKAVLELGDEYWPFPIPIVKAGAGWLFDTKEGKQEILNRRIGRNELRAIQACLAFFDAQRDYASKVGDGKGLPQYAQKFFSEPGKKDGLYWDAKEGEAESPLGLLFAAAHERGYTRKTPGQQPSPYLGYYYRILSAQGKHAAGGAHSYLMNGKMVGGFALVAYPAQYGVSGIMTFMVSHSGVVYERDLGKMTEAVARAMKIFDPDGSWRKVEPKYLEPYREGSGA